MLHRICLQSGSDSAVERDGWRGWLHEATLCRKLDSIRRDANIRPRTASRAKEPCEEASDSIALSLISSSLRRHGVRELAKQKATHFATEASTFESFILILTMC